MNEEAIIKKRIKVFVLIFVAFVLVIVGLSLAIPKLTDENYKIDIVNKQEIKKDSVVDEKDFKRVQKELRRVLQEYYNTPENEAIEASVRESSYKETNYSGKSDSQTEIEFLMDVENNKATYWVYIIHDSNAPYAISLNCANVKESKYPDTFCIGTNDNSSIDANLEDLFPYRKIENGKQIYKATHPTHSTGILLAVDANCDDETAKNAAVEDFKKIITERGMNTDGVVFSFDESNCKAYEDHGGGGHGDQNH
jgi:hypothetical protein